MSNTGADQWLGRAVERLRGALDPELVILFGSRARGTATRRSDIDLLVVWETDESPLDRIGHLLGLLSDSPWPLEVLAYTPSELQRLRDRPFLRGVLREGEVLYERRAA